ncbi:tyrosine--tRNA ligase [Anaerosalibacter bizertensis]|uniref:Tyrosine--tRNA ligase n=1 Tax=Anaerosalibacter bizertensis TaxID=932217 RepID=A0A9Q4AE62_9FIRM|nr:tyrosine--tRNA ligase [Anaerosalibacter bizertensis]MBV1820281.1 tyrosine--tRNA ligase [Bacteroidales bacterium MSK.15.36]MCB5560511.1 tyrosine--tRNA ligase [Anaerosalibacter bizertensis]MCG4565996.1 tyrosine--tRNA ligase [Anaerosalibacter bizertensis]MCG4583390.1 tyrosine--tRNA ligase [Anaerosalibacter bizertensis]
MENVFDILKERGYIDQVTYEDELKELLGKEPINFYIGFDATADSLTLGHFVQIMVMKHMQNAGHRPIALLGGGTTMVGDPSGKSDMRKMMTKEQIDYNAKRFEEQLSRFIDFDDNKAMVVNNADWLLDLNFLEFMREIGVHFSVNRMLSFDCYKNRLDKGLTFFEFSYMLMQSYDYLKLYREHNCRLQVGGSDQWSNILSGYELVRKLENAKVYAMTFKLLTTAAGTKMGKTEAGTIWLDPEKTPPYELYQYLRNVDDRDVENFLAVLTFLSMEEVRKLGALEGAEINKGKEVLAFEVTKMVHGEEEALKAQKAAKSLFEGGIKSDSIPTTEISKSELEKGIGILNLLTEVGLTKSNGEARRLIKQGGLYMEDKRLSDPNKIINIEDFTDNKLLLRKGKKVYHQVKLV